jgi:beta-glucosidase
MAFYPGEEGGTAVADVLLGDVSPSGRLPVTFYESTRALPAFTDYAMAGRTYRFLRAQPVYAFGHGLSYTTFRYADLKVTADAAQIDVENTGSRAAATVVQVYASALAAPFPAPRRSLVGFARVTLPPGARQTMTIPLPPEALTLVDPDGRRVPIAGPVRIAVGGRQPDDDGGYGDSGDGQAVQMTVTYDMRSTLMRVD